MSTTVTMEELMKMQHEDLLREVRAQQTMVEKLRIGIKMSKEKDTAKYRREKRQLARMHTALTRKKNPLNAEKKAPTVSVRPAPEARTPAKTPSKKSSKRSPFSPAAVS